MNAVMTAEQRLFFETNGYLLIRDALSPEKLAEVRAAADRAEQEWRSDNGRLGERGEALQSVQAIIEYDPIFLNLLEHPTIFPIIREVIGDDISMVDNDYYISPPVRHLARHHHWHF